MSNDYRFRFSKISIDVDGNAVFRIYEIKLATTSGTNLTLSDNVINLQTLT